MRSGIIQMLGAKVGCAEVGFFKCAVTVPNRILATHARLPPMFTPKLIPTAWMPVKLTGSVVGRLDGVHDDNNKRFSLSLFPHPFSPSLSLAALRLSRFARFPFLRLFFSRSHLARARAAAPLISRFVCAFKHGFPSSVADEDTGGKPGNIEEREREREERRKKRVGGERERRAGDLGDVK